MGVETTAKSHREEEGAGLKEGGGESGSRQVLATMWLAPVMLNPPQAAPYLSDPTVTLGVEGSEYPPDSTTPETPTLVTDIQHPQGPGFPHIPQTHTGYKLQLKHVSLFFQRPCSYPKKTFLSHHATAPPPLFSHQCWPFPWATQGSANIVGAETSGCILRAKPQPPKC